MSAPDNEFPGLVRKVTKPVKAESEVFCCFSETSKFLDVAVEELHIDNSRLPTT